MPRKIDIRGSHQRQSRFERFAAAATNGSGRAGTFIAACLIVVVWGATGPYFHFSDTWQIVINTGTTIITFLMVFLLQHAQNKSSVAIQLKLNELIASHMEASNRMVAIEDLSDEELEVLNNFYCRLAALARKEGGIKSSHSLDEAGEQHARKLDHSSKSRKRARHENVAT